MQCKAWWLCGYPFFINLFSSIRHGNEFFQIHLQLLNQFLFSAKHGVNENHCATIMRSWVVIGIALWCHGWVELIKHIKGDHCCSRHWLWKIRASLVNDKYRKKESRQKEMYLRNKGTLRYWIQNNHTYEAMLKHIGQNNDNGPQG